MDIGGIKRVATTIATQLRKNATSTNANERDAHGHNGYEQQRKPTTLTPEQEAEAIAALNAQPSFAKAGLKAELVKEDGKAPHVIVRDANGNIIRHLAYAEMINIYANRKNGGSDKGTLLNRAA